MEPPKSGESDSFMKVQLADAIISMQELQCWIFGFYVCKYVCVFFNRKNWIQLKRPKTWGLVLLLEECDRWLNLHLKTCWARGRLNKILSQPLRQFLVIANLNSNLEINSKLEILWFVYVSVCKSNFAWHRTLIRPRHTSWSSYS